MITRMFTIVLMIAVLSGCSTFHNRIEQGITANLQQHEEEGYVYGYGFGGTEAEARSLALEELAFKIHVQVIGNTVTTVSNNHQESIYKAVTESRASLNMTNVDMFSHREKGRWGVIARVTGEEAKRVADDTNSSDTSYSDNHDEFMSSTNPDNLTQRLGIGLLLHDFPNNDYHIPWVNGDTIAIGEVENTGKNITQHGDEESGIDLFYTSVGKHFIWSVGFGIGSSEAEVTWGGDDDSTPKQRRLLKMKSLTAHVSAGYVSRLKDHNIAWWLKGGHYYERVSLDNSIRLSNDREINSTATNSHNYIEVGIGNANVSGAIRVPDSNRTPYLLIAFSFGG